MCYPILAFLSSGISVDVSTDVPSGVSEFCKVQQKLQKNHRQKPILEAGAAVGAAAAPGNADGLRPGTATPNADLAADPA